MPTLKGKDELSKKKIVIRWDKHTPSVEVLYGEEVVGRFATLQEGLQGKTFDLSDGKKMMVILKKKGPFTVGIVEIDGRKIYALGIWTRMFREVMSEWSPV